MDNSIVDAYKLEVQDNLIFDKIKVESGTTLTLDPMGGNHTILVQDSLAVSGNLNVVGEGTLTLVVTDKIIII